MTEETIFAAALEKGTKAERDAFLEEACAGDAALRRRVEALFKLSRGYRVPEGTRRSNVPRIALAGKHRQR